MTDIVIFVSNELSLLKLCLGCLKVIDAGIPIKDIIVVIGNKTAEYDNILSYLQTNSIKYYDYTKADYWNGDERYYNVMMGMNHGMLLNRYVKEVVSLSWDKCSKYTILQLFRNIVSVRTNDFSVQ